MKFKASINIMPLKELLDPQGKAVESGLKNLELSSLSNVRIGKRITLEVDASDESDARAQIEKACKEMLANQVMESFEYQLEAV